jgi:hypothetical protein
MRIKEDGFQQNCIIDDDFNTRIHQKEKKRGPIVRDVSKESMEVLVSKLDLFYVHPNKDKYTWSNKCSRVDHILARLD